MRLVAIRGRDAAALVLALLRGRFEETLSFAGVLALTVVLGGFAGRPVKPSFELDFIELTTVEVSNLVTLCLGN